MLRDSAAAAAEDLDEEGWPPKDADAEAGPEVVALDESLEEDAPSDEETREEDAASEADAAEASYPDAPQVSDGNASWK